MSHIVISLAVDLQRLQPMRAATEEEPKTVAQNLSSLNPVTCGGKRHGDVNVAVCFAGGNDDSQITIEKSSLP
jgi:hypothetical protein